MAKAGPVNKKFLTLLNPFSVPPGIRDKTNRKTKISQHTVESQSPKHFNKTVLLYSFIPKNTNNETECSSSSRSPRFVTILVIFVSLSLFHRPRVLPPREPVPLRGTRTLRRWHHLRGDDTPQYLHREWTLRPARRRPCQTETNTQNLRVMDTVPEGRDWFKTVPGEKLIDPRTGTGTGRFGSKSSLERFGQIPLGQGRGNID